MTTLKRQPVAINPVLPAFRICVYGEGGVGKTSLALTFPKVLVVDTDGGLEGDAVAGITEKGGEVWYPDQWKDCNDLYFWLKENVEKKGYKTIVIDSVDTLCRFIRREATAMPNSSRKANQLDDILTTSDQQDYGKVEVAMESGR